MNALEIEKASLGSSGLQGENRVVEINLLLEARLLAALEAVAKEQGLTAAMMTRRLIRDFLHQSAAVQPAALTENPLRQDAAREMRHPQPKGRS